MPLIVVKREIAIEHEPPNVLEAAQLASLRCRMVGEWVELNIKELGDGASPIQSCKYMMPERLLHALLSVPQWIAAYAQLLG